MPSISRSGRRCRSRDCWRRRRASCWAFRCCACAATISPSLPWASARSSISCCRTWTLLTGGPNGIGNIPRPGLFGLVFAPRAPAGETTFQDFLGVSFSPTQRIDFLYYIVLALALVTNLFTLRVRVFADRAALSEALREDEIACRALGINPVSVKLSAFGIGAMLGGFAGAFFATRQGFISPESFTFTESATILAIVVLGGMGSQMGVEAGGPARQPARIRPRPCRVPHADLWRGDGRCHGVAAGRVAVASRTVDPACFCAAWATNSVRRSSRSSISAMRFGGLVAVDDVSFTVRSARDHRRDRVERRRQDHRLQLPDRLLSAERRAS